MILERENGLFLQKLLCHFQNAAEINEGAQASLSCKSDHQSVLSSVKCKDVNIGD